MSTLMKFHGMRPYFVSLPPDDLTGIPWENVWWLDYIFAIGAIFDPVGEN